MNECWDYGCVLPHLIVVFVLLFFWFLFLRGCQLEIALWLGIADSILSQCWDPNLIGSVKTGHYFNPHNNHGQSLNFFVPGNPINWFCSITWVLQSKKPRLHDHLLSMCHLFWGCFFLVSMALLWCGKCLLNVFLSHHNNACIDACNLRSSIS